MIRAAIYALLFYPATAFFVLACMAASPFGSDAVRWFVHRWTDTNHWLARMLGTRVEVHGAIPAGAYLIAVKHQSMFETLEMVRLAKTPIVVLKRELADMPGFGWATRRYGVIPVDRDAGAKALRDMLALGKQAVETGRPVIIYPEGTRVRVGQTPPLASGFAGLYRALAMPVIPVALDSGRTWGANLPWRAGSVHIIIGDAIPAGLRRDEIERRVHAAINRLESGAQASA